MPPTSSSTIVTVTGDYQYQGESHSHSDPVPCLNLTVRKVKHSFISYHKGI